MATAEAPGIPHDTIFDCGPRKGRWTVRVPLTHVEEVLRDTGKRKRVPPAVHVPQPSPPFSEAHSVLALVGPSSPAPQSPLPPPPKPPEDKYKKKLRLLREARDANDIDEETYLKLAEKVFDERTAAV